MDESNKPSFLERLSALLTRGPEDREHLLKELHTAFERNLLDGDALSMIEGARRAQEEAEHAERQEEVDALAKANQLRGLGTFGELLQRSLDKKR